MAKGTFDSQPHPPARSGKSVPSDDNKSRSFSGQANAGSSAETKPSDDQIFKKLKTIFRGPVSSLGKGVGLDKAYSSSISDPLDPLSKGLYNGETSAQSATTLNSFDMGSCTSVGSLDSVGKLGYGESVMCLDTLAQALAADSASFADKEKTMTSSETPLTHLSSVDPLVAHDAVTPLGGVSLEVGCDFADRVGKLLGRCVSGDEIARDELAALCAHEFNIPDSALSPALVAALLRFCMLKGQLYLAGQLLQVAWDRGVKLSPVEQSQVLLSLCSGEAIGLVRSLLSKLPFPEQGSDEIMSLFVRGVVATSKQSKADTFSTFVAVLEDSSSGSLEQHRGAHLLELFFSELGEDVSRSVEIVDYVQRLCQTEAFQRVSNACRFRACTVLCCAEPSDKADECIRTILTSEGSNTAFMEHVGKHSHTAFVDVVTRLLSIHALNGMAFITALCMGHRISPSSNVAVKICVAAQRNLRGVVPEKLRSPGFGDFGYLSYTGVNPLVQLFGTTLPTSMLGVCASVSGSGKEMFTPLVESCLLVEDLAAAESVLKYMNEYYGHVPPQLLVKMLQSHLLHGNFRYVLERLAKKDKLAGALRNRQNRFTCTGIADYGMRVAIASLNFESAIEFQKHCEIGDKISSEVSALLQQMPAHLVSRSKVDEFVTLCERLNLDEGTFSVALDCCLRLKNSKRLVRLINRFRRMGLQPQLQTCGVIIKSLGCCGRIAECKEIWQEMAANRGSEPNEVTYGIMLDAYVNNNRMDEAMALFQEMKQKSNVKPNTIMYTTLIKGFGQNRQLGKAMSIYRMMVTEGIARNTVTYNSIIDACARVGDMKAAAALLEEMMINQVEPDLITFSTIIKGYCVQCNMDQSFQLLSIMYERGIKPDGILYNSLLEGCVKSGRLWLCEKLWEQMRLHGIAPSNFTLTILIKMYGRSGQLDKVFDLVGRLPVEYNFTINAHVYTCLMSACITNGRYSTALDIFRCMKDVNIKPDAKTYETLLQGVTRGGLFAEAVDVLREMYNLDDLGAGAGAAGPDSAIVQKVNPRVLENLFNKVQHARLSADAAETYRLLSKRLQSMGVNVHYPS
ncbi:pentatricopeptide repeat domain-containing protein [Babesia caballi]|uniref:Pentatricopeptide repeat domain-containing protein n=1 Tax=Babesia caballi TaxID=5871 RepID=A0AAV4M102_BABCB|nr:pentatricopeptide repeat domain-containing protein [Babesia caballi]